MKTKKFTLLALALVILVAIAGCAPTDDSGFNNRLGTQTRIGNNGIGQNNWRNNNMSGTNDFDTDLNGTNNGFNNNRLNTNVNTNTMGNASELARRIGALPEVERAAVAISGNRAIVGVNLNNNGTNGTDNGRINNNNANNGNGIIRDNNNDNGQQISSALRRRIETIVKDTNRNITSVSITADTNLFDRIQNLSNNNNNNGGGILNTIGNDFEDLFRRITPNTNMNNNMINR